MPTQPLTLSLDLLDRVIAGETTESDKAVLACFAREHPRGARFVERLRTQYMRSSGDPARLDRMLNDVLHEIATSTSREKSTRSVLKGSGVLGTRTLRRGAWSLVGALTLGVILMMVSWPANKHTTTPMLAYTTGNGQRATVTLPDGGTVALNVASRLEVPMNYMAGNHTVRLVGEGLFTASHHTDKPLTVLAGTMVTHVLGTRFVVRDYPTDTAGIVAVADGRVAVGTTIVAAHQVAEVGPGGVLRISPASASLFSFSAGMLTLDNIPLRRAILELNRWYDVDIRLADLALATQPIKGEFAAGSVKDLVAILEYTFDVRAVRDGRVITLFPKH